MQRSLNFGEALLVCGSNESLGAWEPHRALALNWSDGDVWRGSIEVQRGEEVRFKVVTSYDNNTSFGWDDGEDTVFRAPTGPCEEIAVVADGRSTTVLADDACLAMSGDEADGGSVGAGGVNPHGSFWASEGRWSGGEVRIMSANEHPHEVDGRWDVAGLSGPALALVEGDRENKNWKSKVELVAGLVRNLEENDNIAEINETLALCSIYLQWVSTGTIRCAEDGGHHRPNHLALASRDVFVSGERRLLNPPVDDVGLVRRMQPWLPSFAAEFTCSVPMTRIRDIAHRNDIPSDLKKEIKHTLQNKLHRNAGPEDLVATEALLGRVLAEEGNYSPDFVSEFRTFHAELKEFFNAGGTFELAGKVDPVVRHSSEGAADTLDRMWRARDSLEADGEGDGSLGGGTGGKVFELLRAITDVRSLILGKLAAPLLEYKDPEYNGHGKDQQVIDPFGEGIDERQRLRLAELGLERYAFVLLARVQGLVEAADGGGNSPPEVWSALAEATSLGLRHVGLSGFRPDECREAAAELAAAEAARGGEEGTAGALRVRAAAERAQRVVEEYTDAAVAALGPAATRLGAALGVPDTTARVFAEADVRAGVPFQLSRTLQTLHQAATALAGGDGFEVVVPGAAAGVLRQAPTLEVFEAEEKEAPSTKPTVLLVDAVTGDEELAGRGGNLSGIVLRRQQLPHLSHLAVRARQEGVVLVTASTVAAVDAVAALVGCEVSLDASAAGTIVEVLPEGTALGDASTVGNGASAGAAAAAAADSAVLAQQLEVLPLEAVTTANGGAKAAACAELARLAAQPDCTFAAPTGVCLPFGSLELADADADAGLASAVGAVEVALEGGNIEALDAACDAARAAAAASAAALPEPLLAEVLGAFPADSRVVVRSSANVEDLAGLSGAGLYDSVYDVALGSTEALRGAIGVVWGSLYTRRAALARRAAGLPEASARMAVLIQPLLAADTSFVLHTHDPTGRAADAVCAEVAVGLGETLACAANSGSAWRLLARKDGGGVDTLSFANFSEALRVDAARGVVTETVAYQDEPLTASAEARVTLGERLAAAGAALESHFGAPQDVEGAVVDGVVHVVQSRPQPGVVVVATAA